MFYYGFLIENNKHNGVYLKLYLNPSDPYVKIKEKMLGIKYQNFIKLFKYFENFDNNLKPCNKLLGYLRFIEYDGDLNKITKHFKPKIEDIKKVDSKIRKLKMPVISIENEKKMLIKLKQIAEKCINKFPTTYEEDQKILQENSKLSFNERNCIIFRAGEKKVYKLMISLADIGLAILSKKGPKMSVLDLNNLAQNVPFGEYIKRCIIPLVGNWK